MNQYAADTSKSKSRVYLVHLDCYCCNPSAWWQKYRKQHGITCKRWDCHYHFEERLKDAGLRPFHEYWPLGGRDPWVVVCKDGITDIGLRVYTPRRIGQEVPEAVQEHLYWHRRGHIEYGGRIWVRSSAHGCTKRAKHRIACVNADGVLVVDGGDMPLEIKDLLSNAKGAEVSDG